ncbi:MAG: SPOR domain-containing protein [Burkholderiaceae bacterium]
MGWLSFFKPQTERTASADSAAASPDSVARARTRARQRLVGAIVLVAIGVIGFPLVFETRPRPIPVDVAIEIPRKDNVAALKVPAPAAPQMRPDDIVTETPAEAGRGVATQPAVAGNHTASAAPPPASAPGSAKPSVAAVPASPPPPAPAVPAVKPATPPEKPALKSDGARAKALLDGAATSAKTAGRFVVQVGAFAEASAASELRGKAEKLGLKTYTQVADTPAGKRIRVRLGPFASRDEADSALAKARAGGLAGNVLTL